MNYQTGKVFTEELAQTTKFVGGRYIVFTMQSKYYSGPVYAIATFDQESSAIKAYGLYRDTLTEGTLVYDKTKKICAESSAYGDGFLEITVGSYSDTGDSAKTIVYKHGVLFMTREAKRRPVAAGQQHRHMHSAPPFQGSDRTPDFQMLACAVGE